MTTPDVFHAVLRQLALMFFQLGAVLWRTDPRAPDKRGWRLKKDEGKPDGEFERSPIYFNLRTQDNPKPGPLTPEALDLIGRVFYMLYQGGRLVKPLFHHVAGVPNAGDPLADAFARVCGEDQDERISVLRLEKEDTGGGRRRVAGVCAGAFRAGEIVLALDDLVTAADSKLELVDALAAQRLVVRDIMVLIDREQGGREELERRGVRLHAVFPMRTLLNFYVRERLMTMEMHDEIIGYLRRNGMR